MSVFNRWMSRIACAVCCALLGPVWVPNVAEAAPGASWAVVDSDGTIARGHNTVSATHISTGRYAVLFSSNVSQCAYEAVAGNTGSDASLDVRVTVAQGRRPGAVTLVLTRLHTGALIDASFHVVTYCGSNRKFAVVASNGVLARGSHVTSSQRLSAGSYAVTFDHKVDQCTFNATVGSTDGVPITSPGELTVAGLTADKSGVFVKSLGRVSGNLDSAFHLAVDCGATAIRAVINIDGTTARGPQVVSSGTGPSGPGLGDYQVFFDRDVSSCAFIATVGVATNRGAILESVLATTSRLSLGVPDAVEVLTHSVEGHTQDEPFHLTVTC